MRKPNTTETPMPRLLRRNIWIETGISLFLLAFFTTLYLNVEACIVEAMPSMISPAFFPRLIALILAVLSAALLAILLRAAWHMLSGTVDRERLELQEAGEEAGRFLALAGYVGILFLYLIGLHLVGFVCATPVVMLLVSLTLGLRRWLAGLAAYIVFTLLIRHAAFQYMQIILPTGLLFE